MKTLVANWKMNFTLHEEIEWCVKNLPELAQLPNKLILCPSALALVPLANLLRTLPETSLVSLGAQTCSSSLVGAHTGQLSALSLKQAGCSYVIVGHSEERSAYRLSNDYVANQTECALAAGLTPIICIGESEQEHDSLQTYEVIKNQLAPVLKMVNPESSFCVAYEPVWAIGSGNRPTIQELAIIFKLIKSLVGENQLFYGGSVDENYARECDNVPYLNGFLLGKKSLNFQELKKIVSLS